MADASQKLAALMFTDIVGYSRLMGENEYSTVDLVQIYRDNLTRSIEENNGQVRDFIGDGLFASFGCGLDAVRAGIQIQLFLHEFNRSEARRSQPALIARVGIHLGDVLEMDGKLYGDDVNIAARLEPLAEPGALCVSQAVFDQLNGDEKVEIVKLGPQKLKNIKKVFECYQLLPQAVTFQQRLRMAKRYFLSQLRVRPKRTAAAALVIFTFIGYLGVREWQARQIPEGYYLEVADFTNAGNKAGGTNYFSEGITDAVRAQLAGIDKLYLVRSDERVGAPLKLEGSVLREEGRIRVIYRITRRKDGILIGGKTHDGVDENIFGLQDKLASSIAADLTAHYEFTDVQLAQAKFTSDITAYDYYMQGRGYFRRGKTHDNLDNSIDFYRKATFHDAGFAQAYAGLCDAYWWKYDLTRDESWIENAETSCGNSLELGSDLPEAHIAIGRLLLGGGDFEGAIESFQKALEIDSKNDEALSMLAISYQESGADDLAEESYQRAISIKPGYWGGYDRFASYLLKRGQFLESIDMYSKALDLTPNNVALLTNLGAVYFYVGDFERASHVLRKSVTLAPTAQGFSNAGTAAYYSGEFDEAVQMLEQAIQIAPKDYRLMGNLADALIAAGQLSEAETYYKKGLVGVTRAIQLNPKNPELYAVLANIHMRLGNMQAAKENISEAMGGAPKNVSVLHINAIVHNRLGNKEKVLLSIAALKGMGYASALLENDPEFKNLRGDAEFKRILEDNP